MPDSKPSASRVRSIQARDRVGKKICIDLGSTQTRVSVDAALVWQQPTCLAEYKQPVSSGTVGAAAYQLLGKQSHGTQLIFPIDRGAVSSIPHAVDFLKSLRKELAISSSLMGVIDGLLQLESHVALQDSCTPLEREHFHQVWSESGWPKVRFVAAPRAIMAAHQSSASALPQCVIDLGGQVSFLSILQGENVLASERLDWGGIQLTDAIQRVVREKYHCAVSWHAAEKIKRELAYVSVSDTPRARRQAKLTVSGKDLGSQLGKTIVIEAEHIIAAIESYPQLLLLHIQHFFSEVSAEIVSSCLEQGIVLTGGGANLSGLSDYLHQSLKTEVKTSDHPELDILVGLQNLAGLGT